MTPKHILLALIYDFDGTLAPGNVQEPQFIPDIGMKPEHFWAEVNQLSKENQADKILMYMRLMLKKANEKGVSVHLNDFHKQGKTIKLFQGVLEWFKRMDAYSAGKGFLNEHYIVSSGNAEIIEGTTIASKFKEIYASRFFFDHNGVADGPAQAINYTTKTQFLFRINKDAHDLSDDTKINSFVLKDQRPIPFENMMYFGDGDTDIPCFRLVKEQGGLSIAVFKPNTKGAREKAVGFSQEGRVNSVAPANYKDGSKLDRIVKSHIDYISARQVRGRLFVGA